MRNKLRELVNESCMNKTIIFNMLKQFKMFPNYIDKLE